MNHARKVKSFEPFAARLQEQSIQKVVINPYRKPYSSSIFGLLGSVSTVPEFGGIGYWSYGIGYDVQGGNRYLLPNKTASIGKKWRHYEQRVFTDLESDYGKSDRAKRMQNSTHIAVAASASTVSLHKKLPEAALTLILYDERADSEILKVIHEDIKGYDIPLPDVLKDHIQDATWVGLDFITES